MIKKILLTILLAAPMTLLAQSKFACFNQGDIITAMPEYKAAMTELESLYAQHKTSLEEMEKEIMTKYEKFQKEAEGMLLQIRDRRAQELQDLQTRYQEAAQETEKIMSEAQEARLRPISAKLQEAVNAVAREGNYVYIVDKNGANSIGLFINEALNEDVTKLIMAKLGITATAAPAPADPETPAK